jgi:hypothetical protein
MLSHGKGETGVCVCGHGHAPPASNAACTCVRAQQLRITQAVSCSTKHARLRCVLPHTQATP